MRNKENTAQSIGQAQGMAERWLSRWLASAVRNCRAWALVVSYGATLSLAVAQELPVTELKVLGGLSTRSTYKQIEQPFWLKTLPEHTAGQITAQIKGFDEMGLKGTELLKLMKQGVIEFGVVPLI